MFCCYLYPFSRLVSISLADGFRILRLTHRPGPGTWNLTSHLTLGSHHKTVLTGKILPISYGVRMLLKVKSGSVWGVVLPSKNTVKTFYGPVESEEYLRQGQQRTVISQSMIECHNVYGVS